MTSRNKNAGVPKRLSKKDGAHSVELLALIIKKGKRDMASFKKAFGKDPDFPPLATIRKTAWK